MNFREFLQLLAYLSSSYGGYNPFYCQIRTFINITMFEEATGRKLLNGSDGIINKR